MGKLAFLFAGQGAQAPGMGQSMYEHSPAAKSALDCAETIRPGTLDMCFNGTDDELRQTINAQPCLFAADLACAEALREAGLAPDGAAGFSLGEMPAAAFCGMLTHSDAFLAVIKRAELMQGAAREHPGTMVAILRLTHDRAADICARFDGRAYPVNYNCPGQTVAAVALDTADSLEDAVKQAGGRALRLNVSGAFHSPWMRGAAEAFDSFLSSLSFNRPRIPIYSNLTATPYSLESARGLMSGQMAGPVMWERTIVNMSRDGFDRFAEVGPGNTLCGLLAKIIPGAAAASVQDWRDIPHALAALTEGKT